MCRGVSRNNAILEDKIGVQSENPTDMFFREPECMPWREVLVVRLVPLPPLTIQPCARANSSRCVQLQIAPPVIVNPGTSFHSIG